MVQPSSQSPADDAADLMLVESSEASVSQVLLLLSPKSASIPDASSSGLEEVSGSPESSSAADAAAEPVPVASSAVSVSDPLLSSSVSSSEPDVSPSRLDDVSLPFEPFDATGSMSFLNVFAG